MVFFMVARTVILLEETLEQTVKLYIFILTLMLCVFIHSFIILPLLYLGLARRNPLKLFGGCFRALMITFATKDRYRIHS